LKDGDDGAVDGSVSIDVKCNDAGDAWLYNGAPITQLECAADCTTCSSNLVSKTQRTQASQPFWTEINDYTGTCVNGAMKILDGDDTVVDRTATIVVTCNNAGNAWLYNGVQVTGLECTTDCRTCHPGLTATTMEGNGAQPFFTDEPGDDGVCLTRKMTCMGLNAIIEVNGVMKILDGDNGVDGSASIVVNCNDAGNAWLYNGAPITQLECAVGCNTCADNLITILMMNPNAQPFMSDMVDNTGPCRTRRLTCMGVNANIEGILMDADDGNMDGAVTVTLNCNAAGDAWTMQGVPITELECAAACRSCADNLITITTTGNGAKPMDRDEVDRTTAACAVRTFTCLGMNANIENRFGVVADGDDGTVDGVSTLVVTCNVAGTAWVNAGMEVTQVEC
ncbi:hypothetical protein PFISCL1PPCAC_14729, partial [Pristionchus fissidentatus]